MQIFINIYFIPLTNCWEEVVCRAGTGSGRPTTFLRQRIRERNDRSLNYVHYYFYTNPFNAFWYVLFFDTFLVVTNNNNVILLMHDYNCPSFLKFMRTYLISPFNTVVLLKKNHILKLSYSTEQISMLSQSQTSSLLLELEVEGVSIYTSVFGSIYTIYTFVFS